MKARAFAECKPEEIIIFQTNWAKYAWIKDIHPADLFDHDGGGHIFMEWMGEMWGEFCKIAGIERSHCLCYTDQFQEWLALKAKYLKDEMEDV